MNDPASTLFSYAMDQNIFPKFIDDYPRFQLRLRANCAARDRLRALLDDPAKKELDALMDEKDSLDAAHLEAAFTAGLSLGLRLLRFL